MLGKPVPEFSLPCTGGTTFSTSTPRKIRFPFELRSERYEALCKQFAVMKQKLRYGKKVRGIERRGVKVPGHAQEVLNFVKAL